MAARESAKVKSNALPWLGVSVLVLVLDQLSKLWVLRSLPEFRPVPVIDGFWNWYRTYNTGAAFSLLGDAGGWQQYLFSGFAVAISAVLAWWLAKTPRDDWKTALPFALVIGGAIGNLLDRLQHGHVVDFIQWYWRDHYWPSFNVADSAIFVAAAILVLGSLRRPGQQPSRKA
jgi:signal peptidase II